VVRKRRTESYYRATKWDLRVVRALDDVGDIFRLIEREKPESWVTRMQLACLEDAVRVIYRAGYKISPEAFAEAVWWIRGVRRSEPGFSFAEIMEEFEFDADAWRTKLLDVAHRANRDEAARRDLRNITRPRQMKIARVA